MWIIPAGGFTNTGVVGFAQTFLKSDLQSICQTQILSHKIQRCQSQNTKRSVTKCREVSHKIQRGQSQNSKESVTKYKVSLKIQRGQSQKTSGLRYSCVANQHQSQQYGWHEKQFHQL